MSHIGEWNLIREMQMRYGHFELGRKECLVATSVSVDMVKHLNGRVSSGGSNGAVKAC